ncbi:hypothetical protein PgNI_10703 [Pyricularia grisea]|uniref:DUF8032 domain-containing protein n=1 Tax=Pyricularia grisea TaxID=148305 RepID=A0A6P8AX76_PYRGI|nr:hypothetical protein PgNI_10703 [Pyricularia grisea]TLD06927.1 hypothetical protein PgNI_10703 [Pyricularia grisea]
MGLAMAPYRQAPGQLKEEPNDSHHPHHPQQQGQAPSHIQPHPRPSSIVQQHHPHAPPQQPQHSSAYSSYQHNQQQNQTSGGQHTQDLGYYAHQSPYSTPGATSGYTSADTSEMMAAAMPRPPYPPMSYHTPQSNSPASVASPSGHDQQRSMYGQPTSQLHQQSMYYGQQTAQYPPMPAQAAQSPYGQHPQQSHQTMTSQPSMMMSHNNAAQHQMSQHGHSTQHAQSAMTGSPRHPKIETHSMPPQLSRPGQQQPMTQQPQQMNQQSSMPQQPPMNQPLGQSQPAQNGAPMQNASNVGSGAAGVNPNAAPGPIPATTPLVVRQDQNGVQWIAFEYSRDRVKMEYTIRCDVESVNTDELSAEFKQENCVYPRACVAKEAYRGNRLQYETECNTVGWALAQLNTPLRGKRGLIQRAVDSWRNSNRDPRLRSRRVRRMAKMTTRKTNPMPAGHMAGGPAGPGGPAGMPGGPGSMGPGGGMGKPIMNSMGQMQQHHHHADGHGQEGGEVGDGDSFSDDQHHHHHHHQAPPQTGGSQDDVRPSHQFSGYGGYQSGAPSGSSSMPSIHDTIHHGSGHQSSGSGAIAARRHSRADAEEPDDLFPDIPEAKKRKFILVEDSDRQSRLRVRVTLDGVDTREIPDSFRKNSSVYPRSYFPREMQSPPPSATGSKFFQDDLSDDPGAEDDGTTDTEGRRAARGARAKAMVRVPMVDGSEGEVAIPRMRRGFRGKEVRLNDLGYRMAWLQSRVFAGRTIFLQRALDCYRNKTRSAIESLMQDVKTVSPHFETRVGKRKWNERMRRSEKKDDTESS